MNENIEVLIIEDDPRIAKIHQRFIEKISGFTVIGCASTGEEASDWLSAFSPNLILLDVYLPDTLGTNLLEMIQSQKQDIDIIFITAASESQIVKKAYKTGVVDYILKPVTFKRFKESLESYRAKYQLLMTEGTMNEDTIHTIWNRTSTPNKMMEDLALPKGIDSITKRKVLEYLESVEDGVTAETLSKEIGVSRSTARRYLEFFITVDLGFTELIYGTVGRPERRYFFKRS
ncbi:response regulator [Rummeliibacillus pycnus]|uniref:response regulator n=1 Tax=Rummeliibacillus pycnus TaxID=101070 RepID=UPI003D2E0CFE